MKSTTLNIGLFLFMFSIAATAQDQHVSACYEALDSGKADEALAHAGQAINADKNNREALLCKGRAHAELKQYDEGLIALKAADKLSDKPADHVIALLLIGNVQKDAGQKTEAIGSYRQALEAAQANNDKTLQRLALNVIGGAHVETGQMNEGLQNFLEASKLAANDTERGEDFGQIASVYNKLGRHDQAIEYQVKAVLMQERMGEPDQYAHAGLELGSYYTAAKDYAQAEKAITKVIKFARDNGSAYWEARANYYLGLTKAEQGQTETARTILLEAHHTARRIGATSLASEIGNAMLKLPAP